MRRNRCQAHLLLEPRRQTYIDLLQILVLSMPFLLHRHPHALEHLPVTGLASFIFHLSQEEIMP